MFLYQFVDKTKLPPPAKKAAHAPPVAYIQIPTSAALPTTMAIAVEVLSSLSSVEQLVHFVAGEEGGGGLSQPLSTHSFSALASLLYAAFSSFT